MSSLRDLVEVYADNDWCIILKVKPGSKMDLILLGCFSGNESMIRVAKDHDYTITIFTDNNNGYSWSANELVTMQMRMKRKMIMECVRELKLM